MGRKNGLRVNHERSDNVTPKKQEETGSRGSFKGLHEDGEVRLPKLCGWRNAELRSGNLDRHGRGGDRLAAS